VSAFTTLEITSWVGSADITTTDHNSIFEFVTILFKNKLFALYKVSQLDKIKCPHLKNIYHSDNQLLAKQKDSDPCFQLLQEINM
jgi:hypothetical protein